MEQFLYKRLEKKEPKINLWFCYPAIESFALASLGYLTIFKDFDLNPDLFVERVYVDSKNTIIPPNNVDCVGFSISFELDILSVIKMLKKYNIPLKSIDRKEQDPIVFAGGPVLMSNPIIFQEFFDFIAVGEKTCLKPCFEILKNKNSLSRKEILNKLSAIEGIYVPGYNKEVRIARDNLKDEIIYTPILSDKSFFNNTFIIELERGCPKLCNFCLASWLNFPTRFVDYEKIIEAIDFGLCYTNKIALLGAYVAGHPDFKKIIEYISSKENIELSISSLRADLADIDLIKTLVKCKQKTATIALEAGSQRLRDLIKKDLTKDQILSCIDSIQKGGLKGVKIYTMIGLPSETQDDITSLVELIKEIKDQTKKNKTPFDITVSTSSFIPKIHTPFENFKRVEKSILKKRLEYLKKNFHKLGVNFRPSSLDWDEIQTFLSTTKAPLADFLLEVLDKGGNLGAYKQTLRKHEFIESDYTIIDSGTKELKEKRITEFRENSLYL